MVSTVASEQYFFLSAIKDNCIQITTISQHGQMSWQELILEFLGTWHTALHEKDHWSDYVDAHCRSVQMDHCS